jgi:hypothetical protein
MRSYKAHRYHMRVWDSEENRFLKNFKVKVKKGIMALESDDIYYWKKRNKEFPDAPVNPSITSWTLNNPDQRFTLEERISTDDKNKPIFLNDFIKYDHYDKNEKLIQKEVIALVEEIGGVLYFLPDTGYIENIFVIGNIHKNKEFLETCENNSTKENVNEVKTSKK